MHVHGEAAGAGVDAVHTLREGGRDAHSGRTACVHNDIMSLGNQATVIHNAASGNGKRVDFAAIERCLRDQGLEPIVHRTESTAGLDEILQESSGLVITCGGDGTLAAVCQRVTGRHDVQIVHVPLGTANNLGHSLGVPADPIEALADLASRMPQSLDLGNVRQGGRSARFVEGFGCGVFAELLHRYDPRQGKSVMRAFKTIVDVLPSFEPVHVRASVDGHDVSGEYLIFSVLNTKRIGPWIELAPDADPFDKQFEIVGVKPNGRTGLLAYAKATLAGEIGELDGVVLRKGRTVDIFADGGTFHLDTETFETMETEDASRDTLHVAVDDDSVTMLIPSRCE